MVRVAPNTISLVFYPNTFRVKQGQTVNRSKHIDKYTQADKHINRQKYMQQYLDKDHHDETIFPKTRRRHYSENYFE